MGTGVAKNGLDRGSTVDISGDLYMVSLSDGRYVDSFYENQLERAW